MFMDCALLAGTSLKGYILVADVEELQEHDVSEDYVKRIKTKEVLVPKEGETFIFTCADGSVKLAGQGSQVRPSNCIRQNIEEVEEHRR